MSQSGPAGCAAAIGEGNAASAPSPIADGKALDIDGETPLDRLLATLAAQKIDPRQMSILALVEAFSDALQGALTGPIDAWQPAAAAGVGRTPIRDGAGVNLAPWGDALVLAATLAWLRSRLLLPPDTRAARDAAYEAEVLRQSLLRRVDIAAAADRLVHRQQLGRDVFVARIAPEPADVARGADLADLLRACLVALRLPEENAATRPRAVKLWRLADALARLQLLLPTLPPGRPLAAYLPNLRVDLPGREQHARAALASTLLAGLELARDGRLTLEQTAPWAPVLVFPHPEPAAGSPIAETLSSRDA